LRAPLDVLGKQPIELRASVDDQLFVGQRRGDARDASCWLHPRRQPVHLIACSQTCHNLFRKAPADFGPSALADATIGRILPACAAFQNKFDRARKAFVPFEPVTCASF
jgi:hypothetical protein